MAREYFDVPYSVASITVGSGTTIVATTDVSYHGFSIGAVS